MMRKVGIIVVVLCMAVIFTLKANAEQVQSGSNVQAQGEGSQLRQEIQSLQQQAQQLHSQLQQLEAQAKPLREQLRSIREKIRADREKLRVLRGERREHRQDMRQQHQAQQQGQFQPVPAAPIGMSPAIQMALQRLGQGGGIPMAGAGGQLSPQMAQMLQQLISAGRL